MQFKPFYSLIVLNEASGLNTSQTTLRIQGNGGVFAY
jgi:hypothetical protein